MTDKQLLEIALRYIHKGYSSEQLRWGDDLYNATREEKDICIEYYSLIQEEGTAWAEEHLKTL